MKEDLGDRWRHDTQHNDTQHNDTQHNIASRFVGQSVVYAIMLSVVMFGLRNAQHNNTKHNGLIVTLSITTLRIMTLSTTLRQALLGIVSYVDLRPLCWVLLCSVCTTLSIITWLNCDTQHNSMQSLIGQNFGHADDAIRTVMLTDVMHTEQSSPVYWGWL